MATRTSIWVHGAAFQAEYPADFAEQPEAAGVHFVKRGGEGSSFKTFPSTHNFYVVIPTPSTLEDYLMQVKGITLYYATGASTIAGVSLYDGAKLLGNFDNLNWSGNHAANYDPAFNRLSFGETQSISQGLAIVVAVNFAQPNLGEAYSLVSFVSVGVDLYSGITWFQNIVRWLASIFRM